MKDTSSAAPLPLAVKPKLGRLLRAAVDRYNLLRTVLRSPGIGWAAYRYLFTSEKSIKMQYMTHGEENH